MGVLEKILQKWDPSITSRFWEKMWRNVMCFSLKFSSFSGVTMLNCKQSFKVLAPQLRKRAIERLLIWWYFVICASWSSPTPFSAEASIPLNEHQEWFENWVFVLDFGEIWSFDEMSKFSELPDVWPKDKGSTLWLLFDQNNYLLFILFFHTVLKIYAPVY